MRHHPLLDAEAASWSLHLQPLRVRLEVEEAIGGANLLHLDSLLGAGLVAKVLPGHPLEPGFEPYHLPLPLLCLWREPIRGLPLWASTDFQPVGITISTPATWVSQAMPSRLVRPVNGRPYAPRQTQGPLKLRQVALPTTLAESWEAEAYGDQTVLAELLSALGTHVGAKRGQGWGKIRRWEITPIDTFSLVDAASRLRRPVPGAALRIIPVTNYISCGWTPPYWRGSGTHTLCLPTGTEIDPQALPPMLEGTA